ncbi:MAG: AraC family transcriptional regulator ligand-binding domain-containing protein [Bacteroidota bacterium]
MKYTSINLYRKMVDHARSEGLDAACFEQIPVPIADMDRIQAVPADSFFQLHEMMDTWLGPGFALRVGQEMKMDDYGVLGLSWKTCSQAKEIFERSERYFHLLSNTYVFKLAPKGAYTDVLLFREAHRRGVSLSNEATFSATVVVLQAMTESNIAPTSVSFQHSGPEDQSMYQAVFQCPVHFDQTQNAIQYRTRDLEMRTAKADASINRFLVERVEEATRGIEVSSSRISTDVQELIRDALPSGIPSISKLGRHMGMSSRTLTRRLAENGVSFRELVRKTQEEVSRDLLRHSNRNMAEIAFQTGFSEQSAFSRAFKRWTGQSPIEYRNQR